MKRGQKPAQGFTLVELLIVIVVVAILAVVTIMTYGGIQDRAHDAAVRGDLSTATKLLNIYKTNNVTYPSGLADLSTMADKLQFTKDSYPTDVNAALYCRDSLDIGFALIAKSKSGKSFVVTDSQREPIEYTLTFPTTASTVCRSVHTKYNAPSAWLYSSTNGWVDAVN